jgi:hypothetical protein
MKGAIKTIRAHVGSAFRFKLHQSLENLLSQYHPMVINKNQNISNKRFEDVNITN